MRRVLQIAALTVFFPALAPAQDTSLVARVQGLLVRDGSLRLMAEFGSAAGRWARIFSEPSHTLLLAAVDRDWSATAEGQSWLTATRTDPAAPLIVTSMPASPSVQQGPRPSSDRRIAVWVEAGTGAHGVLAADAMVGEGAFSFSVSVPADAPHGPWPLIRHCCSGGTCQEMCVTCKDPQFACCIGSCCEIWCGWAGECCQH